MGTKKAKKLNTVKGAKTIVKATKTKKSDATKAGETKPADAAAGARAEAVEALDGLTPEAQAAAVEALSDAVAPTGPTEAATAPTAIDAATPPPAPPDAPTAAPATPTGTPPAPAPPADTPDLAALRVDVEEAKARLADAEAETKKLEEEARATLTAAKERYRAALAPYRDACKVQGRECEYEGGRTRSANVSERVTFEVALEGEHVRIAIKGRRESEERLPIVEVRSSPNRAAKTYTEKWLGPREQIGNKLGSLGNRLRAVLAAAGPR